MKEFPGDDPPNQSPGRFPTHIRRTKDFRGDVRPVADLIPHSPWDHRHQLLRPLLAFDDFLVGQFLGIRKESGTESLRGVVARLGFGDRSPVPRAGITPRGSCPASPSRSWY